MKKLTVSIGIPAYNEESNIKHLLVSLFAQKHDDYTLKEVIVVSDGSTDRTEEEVKSINSTKITLVRNKKRLGQAKGQNKIIKLFTGDVLVLLNADVLPADDIFISKLIKPFASEKSIGLVGSKIIPVKGKTFFENVINCSIAFKDSIFERVNNGNNIYLCSGRGRAFKKAFAKKLFWKDSLSEDAFSYLTCLKSNYTFKYVPAAKLYFKSPDNFSDHLKQSARFTQGPNVMSKFLDTEFVKREYSIPKKIALMAVISYLIKSPLLFFCYMVTLLLIKINPWKGDFAQSMWLVSASSKMLKMS